MKITSDFLVVGSGIAGLCYALTVAEQGQVCLITKREIATTATRLAQGGIAAVATSEDSFEQHIQDTMEAGAWLPDEEIVRMVVENGPAAIKDLINWGVKLLPQRGSILRPDQRRRSQPASHLPRQG